MKTGNRHEAPGNSRKAKIFGFTLCAMLFAPSFTVEAQQPGKLAKIGWLGFRSVSDPSPGRQAFKEELRIRGYLDGKNITHEYRFADSKLDRLPRHR
jgi:hypothetical protein